MKPLGLYAYKQALARFEKLSTNYSFKNHIYIYIYIYDKNEWKMDKVTLTTE